VRYPHHLTRRYEFGRLKQLWKNRTIGSDFIIGDDDYNDSKPEQPQVLLTIRDPTPTHLANRLDVIVWKRGPNSRVDALV
jgi:hypothetical protein